MTGQTDNAGAILWNNWQRRTRIDELPLDCRPRDRAAGYAALALTFVAALVVGGEGPVGLLQFATVGIIVLLVVVYLGNRRESAARR